MEVIEVMGLLSDPAYAARKERLLPIMASVWKANKITEVNPTDEVDVAAFFAEHDLL